MSTAPIRVGLVGCGRISRKHFEAYRALPDELRLTAVCDIVVDRAEAAAREHGVPAFSDYEALLASGAVDLVVLATPSGLHAEQAIRAARAGIDVVSEKPMATRWQDGKRMVAAFDRARRRLFVVKQNRLNEPVRRVKDALIAGRFGRVYMVNANVFWCRPQEYYDSAAWRGTWEFDGGAFMNQASHYVDLMDWLVGPVESVVATTATLARRIEVEDTGTVSFRWRSGAIGSLNVTTLAWPKDLEGSITILGEKGTARIGGLALNQMLHWEFMDAVAADRDALGTGYETTSVYGFSHTAWYRNVVDALRGRAAPLTDGREGLRSLELLAAIYLSSRSGRRVTLPLEI